MSTPPMSHTFTVLITGPDPDRAEWEWIAVDVAKATAVWKILGVADRNPGDREAS